MLNVAQTGATAAGCSVVVLLKDLAGAGPADYIILESLRLFIQWHHFVEFNSNAVLIQGRE